VAAQALVVAFYIGDCFPFSLAVIDSQGVVFDCFGLGCSDGGSCRVIGGGEGELAMEAGVEGDLDVTDCYGGVPG